MSLTPTIATEPDNGGGHSELYGWDWSATSHDAKGHAESAWAYSDGTVKAVVAQVAEALGGDVYTFGGKGYQGWSESIGAFDADGYALGRVYYGGDRTDVHLVATSDAADRVRESAVELPGAKTARVDTRVDTLLPFEQLEAIIFDAANTYGSQVTRYETLNPRDGSTNGRTLYLGAPSSAIRVRVYEKWLESPGEYEDGTNRVEVQLRPASRVKQRVSEWSRAQTFCASKVTRDLAEALGAELAPKGTLHVRRGTPDLERTLEVMGGQYGRKVREWLTVSGGDVGKVLDYLTDTPSFRDRVDRRRA